MTAYRERMKAGAYEAKPKAGKAPAPKQPVKTRAKARVR